MILEPNYTIETLKYAANRNLATKEGYQWYSVNFKDKCLVPFPRSKLAVKGELLNDLFQKRLSHKTVIDIGCDKGYFSWLAYHYGATRVVAVDISDSVKDFLDELVRFMKWPVEPMNINLFNDSDVVGKFDYALALAMIHQVEGTGIEEILAKIRSLCKEGSIIEFCDDYSEIRGSSWNRSRFEMIVSDLFQSFELVSCYEAIGDYHGYRYIYDCRC